MKKLLSIIVPIYNAEKYLERCLQSIIGQDITDWECFLIDDHSTDNSKSICEYYALKDPRFKVVRKYNEGPAAARNLGLYLATGEWIGFVDADDWIEPNRFSSAINLATLKNVQIVQCNINVYKNDEISRVWHLGENNRIYRIEDGLIFSDPVYDIGHCWDKVYKAELIKSNNVQFANCDMCEDTFFNIKAFCYARKIYSQADAVYNYTLQQGTLSHSTLRDERKINLIQTLQTQLQDLKKIETFKYLEPAVLKLFESIFTRADQIDYVFPYVDCSKPEWQKAYLKTIKQSIDVQRFDGHEELLKYKFRSIETWMPWVGTIHLLVSDVTQVPDWIDTSKVHIVCHEDFIPKEFLPTFNSCTIEMFLHRIPGLSEKFIYSNDDVYANDVLKPKFFFSDANTLKSDLHNRRLWHEGDINLDWAQIPINSLKLAAKDKPEYLKKYVDGKHLYEPQHVDKPMFKSNNIEVFERYKDEILNSVTRTRSVKNFNQYLFLEYALFHDRGAFETFRYSYLQIGRETDKIVDSIKTLENRPREICCNDTAISQESDFKKISEAFAELYPKKSKYEL